MLNAIKVKNALPKRVAYATRQSFSLGKGNKGGKL